MPAIILSDNGVSSGSAGLKTSGSNDGTLALQTSTAGGTATTAVTINTSQNVGIGTTSPGAKLEVNDATRASVFVQDSAGRRLRLQSPDSSGNPATVGTSTNHDLLIEAGSSGAGANTMRFNTAGSERMRLDASGNLGIGTTSPTARLESSLFSTTTPAFRLRYNSSSYYFDASMDGNGNTIFMVPASNGVTSGIFTFGSAGAERMRLDTGGNLLVGKTTTSASSGPGVQLQPIGYVNAVTNFSTNSFSTYELYSTGAGAYRFFVGAGGTVYATSTTISSLSDQRHKENIRDLDVGLDKIMALKPRLYDWKEGKGANIKNARGFIAQEFEQVFPDLIDEWKDPAPEGEEPYKSVRADLIPVLVKAIQELKAEFDAYKLTHP